MTKPPGTSLAAWVPQLEVVPPAAADNLRTWWGRARRVYPEATLKAWRWGFREQWNRKPG